MMQFLSNLLRKKTKAKTQLPMSASDFFTSMPREKRREIIKQAIEGSNKEQQKILQEYEKQNAVHK